MENFYSKTLMRPLWSRNVWFLVQTEGLRWKQIRRKSHRRKRRSLKNADIACGPEKNLSLRQKNTHFEKSHNAENCKSGDPLRFFIIRFVAKYQKIRRGPLWDIEKFSKISLKDKKRGSLIVPKKVETFCFGMLVKNSSYAQVRTWLLLQLWQSYS